MNHIRENGQKHVQVRVTVDMLSKSQQKAGKDKQISMLYRLLKKLCAKSGVVKEMKDHERYTKPGEKKRRALLLKKANARGETKQVIKEDEPKMFEDYNF